MASRLRSFCSADALMLSYSGERWLISITDMPLPRQSRSSSRMRSSTERGRAAGPALKLKTRLVEGTEAVVVLTLNGFLSHWWPHLGSSGLLTATDLRGVGRPSE